jgi:hypothetical protein
MSKNTITTIIGALTAGITIAQYLLQLFGALSPETVHATAPLSLAAGVAVLGYHAADKS